MTTRDYKILIKALVKTMKHCTCVSIAEHNSSLLSDLCNALQDDNPRFDTVAFHSALCAAMEGK
jgi:hypothetical protein